MSGFFFLNPQNNETYRCHVAKINNLMRQMEICCFQTKPLNRSIEYFEILQRFSMRLLARIYRIGIKTI